MSQLGEYLLQRELLTPEQLRAAEVSQLENGGRLGTNLVRLGYLELEELAAHLSDATGVPLPPPAWLDIPEARAAQVLPMPLIRRFKLLPLALEKTRIHVAMLDPTDAVQLDFIAQASEREVVPYVLPELRQLYWLEQHLGIDRHPHFVNLTARSRQLGLLEEVVGGTAAFSTNAPAFGPAPVQLGLQVPIEVESIPLAVRNGAVPLAAAVDGSQGDDGDDLLRFEDILDDTAPITPESIAAARALGPPKSSGEVAALEAEIHGASDRDAIVELLLRIARAHSRAAALFLVRNAAVSSFRGDGGMLPEQLPAIEVPLHAESLFARAVAAFTPFRGEPPDGGIDGRLLRSLGRDGVLEVLVHPITIRGRVVNLLYADNGPDPFGETSIAALTTLCACVSRGYERLILARKADGERGRV